MERRSRSRLTAISFDGRPNSRHSTEASVHNNVTQHGNNVTQNGSNVAQHGNNVTQHGNNTTFLPNNEPETMPMLRDEPNSPTHWQVDENSPSPQQVLTESNSFSAPPPYPGYMTQTDVAPYYLNSEDSQSMPLFTNPALENPPSPAPEARPNFGLESDYESEPELSPDGHVLTPLHITEPEDQGFKKEMYDQKNYVNIKAANNISNGCWDVPITDSYDSNEENELNGYKHDVIEHSMSSDSNSLSSNDSSSDGELEFRNINGRVIPVPVKRRSSTTSRSSSAKLSWNERGSPVLDEFTCNPYADDDGLNYLDNQYVTESRLNKTPPPQSQFGLAPRECQMNSVREDQNAIPL
jgi:hypothetical protein